MISILVTLVASIFTLAADPIPEGCLSSRNFSAEAYKIWKAPGASCTASVNAKSAPAVVLNKRLELQLNSSSNKFTGFVRFEVPATGTYVIVSDAYPRMDLTKISSGPSLNPSDFGKIRNCGTVSKSLRFELSAGNYQLELISSQGAFLNVLIFPLKP